MVNAFCVKLESDHLHINVTVDAHFVRTMKTVESCRELSLGCVDLLDIDIYSLTD